MGFDMAFMFRYSERENTLAKKKYPDDVPESVKLARLERLIALQMQKSDAQNKQEIGRTFPVLIEGPSRRSKSDMMGRTPHGKVVVFQTHGEVLTAGQTVEVQVTKASSATLLGTLLVPAVSA
ncbi:MAG: TRAM domain-containing protein [Spirochaetia bacterium]|nr:TRAM domain-containing protein [Spirochaetia bacterium]